MQQAKQTIKTPIQFIRFIIFVLFALAATSSYALAGTISGTVTDNAGNPLEGVDVSLANKSGANWANAGSIQTDADGKYTFGGLPANDYRIEFSAWDLGYETKYYGNTSNADEATVITLGADESKTADIKLGKKGVLRGTVKDKDGQALPSVKVETYRCYEQTDGSTYCDSYSDWNTTTDVSGKYVFEVYSALNPGLKYRLKFSSSTYGFEFYKDAATIDEATDIIMAADEERTIDVVLGDLLGGIITGTVTDNVGVALEGVDVTLYHKDGENWSTSGQIKTDADGKYNFPGLPENDYRIEFSAFPLGYETKYFGGVTDVNKATVIVLGTAETKTADIKLGKKGVLRGTVKDKDGQALPSVKVETYRCYEQTDGSTYCDSYSDWNTTTDVSGKYVFEVYSALNPGLKYRVKFSSSTYGFEFYKDAATVEEGEDIIMAADEERTIDVVLGAPDEAPELEVTAVATDGTASEAGDDTGVITVSRTGNPDEALTVNFLVSGTATPGKDYKDIGNSVTIPAGASSTTIEIVPIVDYDTSEDDETVIVSLIDPVAAAGGAQAKSAKARHAAKVGGAPAIVTIINNAAPQGIPTLQQWALVLLIMLLLLSGWYYSKLEKNRW